MKKIVFFGMLALLLVSIIVIAKNDGLKIPDVVKDKSDDKVKQDKVAEKVEKSFLKAFDVDVNEKIKYKDIKVYNDVITIAVFDVDNRSVTVVYAGD